MSNTINEKESSRDCQSINVDRSFPRRGAVILKSNEILPRIRLVSTNHDEGQQRQGYYTTESKNENFDSSEDTLGDLFHPSDISNADIFPNENEDRTVVQSTSQMDIIIDKKKGFYVEHGGNSTFIEILQTCYADMYLEATSKTHRRIILNTILAEMNDRGFRFLVSHKNKHYIVQDEMLILRKIRSVLREELKHP